MTAAFLSVLLFTTRSVRATDAPDSLECRLMSEIYTNGQDLCESMWGASFKYEPDEAKGYTMWFESSKNPNADTSNGLFQGAHENLDECHLEYNHKPKPGSEDLNECVPWEDHGCCAPETVKDAQILKENQGGPEYHWDRCGALSAGCERYFIEEACFYECEPAVGLFRKYPESTLLHDRDGHEVHDPDNDDHNSWQIHQMPIKASYCNAFFEACKNDKFCGHGDFFECAKVSPDPEAEKVTTLENREKYCPEGECDYPEEIRPEPNSLDPSSNAYVFGLAALAFRV